jgi:hypothetical protein
LAVGGEGTHALITRVGTWRHCFWSQLVVEGSRQTITEILLDHVTLVRRTGLRLQQQVPDVGLDGGFRVPEDVSQVRQLEAQALPPLDPVYHGKGEV